MPAVPYDRARHWRPVADAFTKGAGCSRHELRALLAQRARCTVYEGKDPVVIAGVPRALVLGFVVTGLERQTVWWAYTRPANRGQGLLATLLAAAGVDTTREFQMLTRTPHSDQVCRRLARKGWPVLLAEPTQEISP